MNSDLVSGLIHPSENCDDVLQILVTLQKHAARRAQRYNAPRDNLRRQRFRC